MTVLEGCTGAEHREPGRVQAFAYAWCWIVRSCYLVSTSRQ